MVEHEPKWWDAPCQFAIHSIVGIFIFTVIAVAAVALDFLVAYLSDHDVNVVIIVGLKIAEYSIFCADLVLFLVFIWRTATRTFRRL